jgi:hypothetical protein
MVIKGFVVLALAAIIVFFTFPYWASCSAKYETCLVGCDIRHFGSDIKKAACKGSCTTRKISCLSKQIIEPSSRENVIQR